jgi:sulfur relay (sulfurtransferase) DsrC/TusE family protein
LGESLLPPVRKFIEDYTLAPAIAQSVSENERNYRNDECNSEFRIYNSEFRHHVCPSGRQKQQVFDANQTKPSQALDKVW